MVKRLLWALALASALPSHAVESQLLEKVAALPIDYRIVKSCGTWQADGRAGYYRIIVADVYGGAGSELYVQWVLQATQEQPASIVKTLAFPELNNDHAQYDFESVDCEARGGRLRLKAVARYEHDDADRVRDISIQLLDIGKYRLSQKVRRVAVPRN